MERPRIDCTKHRAYGVRACPGCEADIDAAEVSRLREEVERLTRLRAADAEGAANIVARYNAQVAESARLTRELEEARAHSRVAVVATGDGSTDDTAAIQSAIDFAARLAEVERERDAAKAETEEYLRRFTLDLAEHETARERAESALATERERSGKLEKAVARFLVAYPWQGNVPETRELRALLPREPMTGTYAALTPPATPEKPPERCNHPRPTGYGRCTRTTGHGGPCALPPATPNPEEP